MALSRIIYTSTAARDITDEDLRSILSTAKSYNEPREITGLLLSGGERFLQLLEGDPQEVDQLYTGRIMKDPRHSQCKILLQEEADYRLFPNWSMGQLAILEGDKSASAAWASLCDELNEQCPKAQGKQDKAVAYIAGFIESFGDEIDESSFGTWISAHNRVKVA